MGLFDFLKPQSSKDKRVADFIQAAQELAPKLQAHMFPGGEAEIELWTKRVYDAVDGRLTLPECRFIFGAVSIVFKMSGDKSEDRMVESILSRANGKISREDARKIFIVICMHQQAG